MADVILRVGAALDFNPDTVFEPLVKASARAAKLIEKNLNAAAPRAIGGGSSGGGGSSVQARAERLQEAAMRRLHREVESWHRKQAQLEVQQERQKEAAFRRLAKETEQAQRRQFVEAERAAVREAAIRQRANRELARQQEVASRQMTRIDVASYRARAAMERQSRVVVRPRQGFLSTALGNIRGGFFGAVGGSLWGMTKMAMAAPMTIARGTGMDFGIESAVKRATSLESKLTNLSLQSWIPSQNKKYTSGDEIMSNLRPSANAAGYSYGESVDALSKFVSKTGDLNMGLQVFDRMAKLSRATGTELSHMVDAVGDVANGLGDIPDKAGVMANIMATIAGQGKIGAVEIKDLASQMAKMAAIAPHFSVKNKDGVADAGESMKVLGGFAQIIRSQGGKASASATMTSVSAFFNQFSKTARLKGFERFGVNAIESDGKIRDPREVIKDALTKTTGKGPDALKDQRNKLNTMFADSQAKPIMIALQKTYADAYSAMTGTEQEKIEAGRKAVQAEFDKMAKIQMATEEISIAFAKAANTTEAKVARFNNAMTDAGSQFKVALMPAIESSLPLFISSLKIAGLMAKGLGDAFSAMLRVIAPDVWAKTNSEGKMDMAEKMVDLYSKQGNALGIGGAHATEARKSAEEAVAIFDSERKRKQEAYERAKPQDMEQAAKERDAASEKYLKAKATLDKMRKIESEVVSSEEKQKASSDAHPVGPQPSQLHYLEEGKQSEEERLKAWKAKLRDAGYNPESIPMPAKADEESVGKKLFVPAEKRVDRYVESNGQDTLSQLGNAAETQGSKWVDGSGMAPLIDAIKSEGKEGSTATKDGLSKVISALLQIASKLDEGGGRTAEK